MSSDSGNHSGDHVEYAANGEDSVHVEIGRLERELESARAELRLEAALERVRARAMDMHHPDELRDVVASVYTELRSLDFDIERCIIWIFEPETLAARVWMSDADQTELPESYHIPFHDHPTFQAYIEAWKSHEQEWVYELSGDLKNTWDNVLFTETEFSRLPEFVQEAMRAPEQIILTATFTKFGAVQTAGLEPLETEKMEVLKRFGRVLDLTYTRFDDLKQAEAQAREARIEAAMERIRARALAMHSSEELMDVSLVLRQQMGLLGQSDLEVCGIHLYQDDGDFFESWGAIRIPGDDGEIMTGQARFPMKGPEIIEEMIALYRSDETDYVLVNDGEKAAEWFAIMEIHAPELYEKLLGMIEGMLTDELRAYWSFADFSGGSLLLVTDTPPDDDSRDLLRRSADVFDLAYRRFLDLKQAEAQAREARIEASLERVRGRAMAMQKPEDLGEVSILMFDELADLGIKSLRSGISLPLDDERYEFSAATKKADGSTTLVMGNESVNVHPIIRRAYDGYQEQEEYQKTILKGEDLVEYYHAVFDTMPLPDWKERMETGAEAQEGFATFPFSDGWLYAFTPQEMNAEEISVFIRFATAFGLAYQRYHDLTQAEIDYEALLEEKARTERALEELHAIQAQLVEQEKLASLGSLTAGIAHEIKNPLNFVNNFAEVSTELMEELSEAVAEGSSDEAASILKDLRENAEQIARHGKRADSIVKAMMQHAKGGVSEMEEVELNSYLDEYANLAWHGMRARDHGFQAEIERSFDPTVGTVTVMPQELGRVILNLFNNAFDALRDVENAVVTIGTSALENGVEITVSDNGPGIPANIREKIFEPFFTTKATGEGTGLGLSLSYDIVTKGHGGKMQLEESPEGGAMFVITLPA